jgi:diadenosine tetraphosphate (Ap4A) HIT family hydrolase
MDGRLLENATVVGETRHVIVLIKHTKQIPWLCIVPKEGEYVELFDLPDDKYLNVLSDIKVISQKFKEYTKCDKLNIETIGNVVASLHIHIIARFRNDICWPHPIWGHVNLNEIYNSNECGSIVQDLQKILPIIKNPE